MTSEDPANSKKASDRGTKAALYVQTFAALVVMVLAVNDRINFTGLPRSLAITVAVLVTVVLLVAWMTALVRSRSRREGMSAFSITAVVIGAVVVVISWTTLLTASSDTEADADPTSPPTSTPEATPEELEGGNPTLVDAGRLCAQPAEPATASWFLFETAGTERRITIERAGDQPTSIPGAMFSAAGSRVVYVDVADAKRAEVKDLSTMTTLASRTFDGRLIDTTISPDGDHVVLVEDWSGDSRLLLWRPTAGEVSEILDPIEDISSPALSPMADQLAWVKGPDKSGQLVITDLATLDERLIASDGGHPAWSPDGSTLVYSTTHNDGRAIYAVAADGGESWRVTNPVQAEDYDPVVRPMCDGIVYARSQNGTVDLWETRDDGTEERLVNLSGAQSRPGFASE